MTDLSVDLFSFDQFVITKLCKYRNSQRPFLKIADISEGAEPVPVSVGILNIYTCLYLLINILNLWEMLNGNL